MNSIFDDYKKPIGWKELKVVTIWVTASRKQDSAYCLHSAVGDGTNLKEWNIVEESGWVTLADLADGDESTYTEQSAEFWCCGDGWSFCVAFGIFVGGWEGIICESVTANVVCLLLLPMLRALLAIAAKCRMIRCSKADPFTRRPWNIVFGYVIKEERKEDSTKAYMEYISLLNYVTYIIFLICSVGFAQPQISLPLDHS